MLFGLSLCIKPKVGEILSLFFLLHAVGGNCHSYQGSTTGAKNTIDRISCSWDVRGHEVTSISLQACGTVSRMVHGNSRGRVADTRALSNSVEIC